MVMRWRPSRRILAVALFVSLLANLALGGLALARLLPDDLWPWQGAYSREFGPFAGRAVQRLVHSLDSSDRAIVIASLRGHAAELASLSRAMHEERQKVKELLRAPQFDPDAVQAAFAEMRKRGDEMQTALGNAVVEAIGKLPPEARQRLAQ
jgi:uncharacterized membrane protein